MIMKKNVQTPNAPAAIGPYSQAVVCGNLVFTSGQIPLDPTTGTVVGEGIREQAEQVMKNLSAVKSIQMQAKILPPWQMP